MLDFTAVDVCNSAVSCAIQGLSGNIRFAAASAVRRAFHSPAAHRLVVLQARAILTWAAQAASRTRLGPSNAAEPGRSPPALTAPNSQAESKKPRRSAARGLGGHKENSHKENSRPGGPAPHAGASPTSSAGAAPLASSGAANDLSWMQEIGLVKHRMAGLRSRHDEDYEQALHPKSDLMEMLENQKKEKEDLRISEAAQRWLRSDQASTQGMYRAGAAIIERVVRQEQRFEFMRRFQEWSAYARLQQMQRKRFPHNPPGAGRTEVDRMAQENRVLAEKLAATEEVAKAQRTANEALRQRVAQSGDVRNYQHATSGSVTAR